MMTKEKLSWERLKGESAKAYNRFKIFLNLSPEERSLEETQKILNSQKKSGKTKNSKEISIASLEQMSSKWAWFERAALHDHHKLVEEIRENDEDFRKTNEKFKKTFKNSLDFAEDLLQELIDNANGNALSTRINMFYTLMKVLNDLYINYRLACGRSTRISESTNEHHVDADLEVELVGEENIYEYTPEEMERIQNISNEQEDFTDKL